MDTNGGVSGFTPNSKLNRGVPTILKLEKHVRLILRSRPPFFSPGEIMCPFVHQSWRHNDPVPSPHVSMLRNQDHATTKAVLDLLMSLPTQCQLLRRVQQTGLAAATATPDASAAAAGSSAMDEEESTEDRSPRAMETQISEAFVATRASRNDGGSEVSAAPGSGSPPAVVPASEAGVDIEAEGAEWMLVSRGSGTRGASGTCADMAKQWEELLPLGRNWHKTVYTLQIVDALLLPAPVSFGGWDGLLIAFVCHVTVRLILHGATTLCTCGCTSCMVMILHVACSFVEASWLCKDEANKTKRNDEWTSVAYPCEICSQPPKRNPCLREMIFFFTPPNKRATTIERHVRSPCTQDGKRAIGRLDAVDKSSHPALQSCTTFLALRSPRVGWPPSVIFIRRSVDLFSGVPVRPSRRFWVPSRGRRRRMISAWASCRAGGSRALSRSSWRRPVEAKPTATMPYWAMRPLFASSKCVCFIRPLAE